LDIYSLSVASGRVVWGHIRNLKMKRRMSTKCWKTMMRCRRWKIYDGGVYGLAYTVDGDVVDVLAWVQ